MKRKLPALFLALTLCLSLAACGGGDGGGEVPDRAPANELTDGSWAVY